MLAREVLRLRGTLANREAEWDVVVDLYFYRDPEAEENKEIAERPRFPVLRRSVLVPSSLASPVTTGMSGCRCQRPRLLPFAAASAAAAGTSWEADGGDWAAAAPLLLLLPPLPVRAGLRPSPLPRPSGRFERKKRSYSYGDPRTALRGEKYVPEHGNYYRVGGL